ncbi:MAG: toll/interleukin-1 receptor domain-containing protein [Candidatus Acidiferrales bacterium]
MGRALARCDWFVIVLSRKSVRSEWVERELTYALNHRQYRGRILPVLKERCNFERLSWTLGALQLVKFVGGFERGCVDLLRAWGLNYKRPRNKKGRR